MSLKGTARSTFGDSGHTDSSCQKASIPDVKVVDVKRISVAMPDETLTPGITGCAFMSDKFVVVCDSNNSKVKLLDQSFTIIDSLKFQTYISDVTPLNDKTVIITLPGSHQLQFIEVLPKLTSGRVIQLDVECIGIEIVGGDIYVTCNNNDVGEVRKLDMEGDVTKILGTYDDGSFMFKAPYYLTVEANSKRIYVGDGYNSTVSCLNSDDGDIAFQYDDAELLWPRGLCCDGDGNLLVCGGDSNNVHVINSEGRKESILLSSVDGIRQPYSIAYRRCDNTLIVGCHDEKLMICTLSKK